MATQHLAMDMAITDYLHLYKPLFFANLRSQNFLQVFLGNLGHDGRE